MTKPEALRHRRSVASTLSGLCRASRCVPLNMFSHFPHNPLPPSRQTRRRHKTTDRAEQPKLPNGDAVGGPAFGLRALTRLSRPPQAIRDVCSMVSHLSVSDKCATNCARPWCQVFDEEYGEAPTPCARGTRPSGRPPSKSFGFSNQADYNELNHYVGSKIFGRRCPHVAVDACAKMVLSREGNGRLR